MAKIVAGIVAFTLVRGIVWAFLIPPLDAPDEPSHLIAVAQIRAGRGLPVARILDPSTLSEDSSPRPPAVLAYLAQPRSYAPLGYTHFRALSYESTQPPLYHALCALLTRPLPDDPQTLLYGCRVISALLGALTVFAAAGAARTLAPGRPAFAVGVPLALALWPQFGFQTATITNDIALDLAGASLAWAWAAALRASGARRAPLVIGALTGLGILGKLTVTATLPGTALVLLGRALAAPTRGQAARRFLIEAAEAGLVAAVLVAPWIARNLQVYGEPTGAAAMFGVIHSIYTTRLHLPAETRVIVPPLDEFAWYSFSSFWAVFGWRGVFLPLPFYCLTGALMALGLGGAVAWAGRRWRARQPLPAPLGWTLAAYAITALAAGVSYGIYTLTTDASLQGRYTFVALVPFLVIGGGGILHATPRPATNRVLAGAALGALVLLQGAAWVYIGRP